MLAPNAQIARGLQLLTLLKQPILGDKVSLSSPLKMS